MANDFSNDSKCITLWNLESGALETDSKGTNTLTNYGVDEDTVNYKQGSCSGAFVRANSDRMWRTDANLSDNFPLKSGKSNQTFSFAFWIRSDAIAEAQTFMSKGLSSPNKCLGGYLWSSAVHFWVSTDGDATTYLQHASTLESEKWYHVAFTKNAADDNWRIRIHDDSGVIGVDATGTVGDLNLNTYQFLLGYASAGTLGGNFDEFVVFNKALSVDEIDQIWAGTYSGGEPSSKTVLDYERSARGVARGVMRGAA